MTGWNILSPIPQEEDKLNNKSLSSLGQRGGWIINESGLYALIFGSKLESAKRFKRWVTHEVLPSIRKYGGYVTELKAKEMIDDPDKIIEIAKKMIRDNERL